jgi:uncharacterized membrane protein YoaK (UPF0700 family)
LPEEGLPKSHWRAAHKSLACTEMKTLGREAERDLLLLGVTAGSADAIGYLALGEVFTSNMTGNIVLLGIHLGEGNFVLAGRALYVVTTFFFGLCLGAWLGKDLPEKQWPALASRLIGLEKIILLIFAIGWMATPDKTQIVIAHGFLALLALAMGLQSSALYRLSAPGVGTTAITGTLTAFATGLINLFAAKADPVEKENGRRRVRFQLAVVFLYCCGAAVNGLLIMQIPRLAGCLPILAAAFVAWRPWKAD